MTLDAAALRAALAGRVEPPRLGTRYRLALVAAAGTMLLLPLAYFALVATVVAATVVHAVRTRWLLTSENPFFGAAWWVLVLAFGLTLALFLVKPFLRRRRDRATSIVVDAREQPLLHELVERTCLLLGAPLPQRIEVDCSVNASAHLHRSWRHPWGEGLVLTIGLPLAAGSTLPQLAGVVAHEIGHFAQGTAMPITSTIRTTSAWLARVVHERDAWDVRLEQWSEAWFPLSAGLLLLRLVLGTARLALRGLLLLGLTVSAALQRQMEHDADAHEAAVAGSEVAVSTFAVLATLGCGASAAGARLSRMWEDRTLADDLPDLFVRECTPLRPDQRDEVERELGQRRARLLHTHPSPHERIVAIRAAPQPGLIRVDAPARALFRDFDALCRRATLVHYEAMLEQELVGARYVSSAVAIAGHEGEASPEDALRRAFEGGDVPDRLALPAIALEGKPSESLVQLRLVRDRLANARLASAERADLVRGRLVAALELLHDAAVQRRLPGGSDRVAEADELVTQLASLEASLVVDREQWRTTAGRIVLIVEAVERTLGLPPRLAN